MRPKDTGFFALVSGSGERHRAGTRVFIAELPEHNRVL